MLPTCWTYYIIYFINIEKERKGPRFRPKVNLRPGRMLSELSCMHCIPKVTSNCRLHMYIYKPLTVQISPRLHHRPPNNIFQPSILFGTWSGVSQWIHPCQPAHAHTAQLANGSAFQPQRQNKQKSRLTAHWTRRIWHV